MEYHERASPAKLSSTSSPVSSFSTKHVYDGVFSGPSAKVMTGMDDYSEIFRGAGGSIPVLDVSELKDRNFSPVDAVRHSKLDYSKIFGGFADADYGVPYEELVAKPKKPKNVVSQETRVPVEARSKPPTGLERVQSAEVSSQSADGVKQVNVLYNKTSPGCKNGVNGTTHIAQLHAIPGYTCLMDEISPSRMPQGGKPVRSVLHEAHLNGNVDSGLTEGKPRKKAVSGPQPGGGFKSMSGNDNEVRKKSSRSGSLAGDMSFDGFEIGLGMHSSSPPTFSNGSPGFFKPVNMKTAAPKSDVSEGADGSYSPPFFYEEMDSNSAAAASAAAVRKAIEEAQAKIKIARDLMERRKEGLQNGAKLRFNSGFKSQKTEVKVAAAENRSEEKKARKMSEKEDAQKHIFTGLDENNAKKASQIITDFGNRNKSFTSANNKEETQSTNYKSAQVGDVLKKPENGKATEKISEHVGPREDRMTESVVQKDGGTALAFKWAENLNKRTPLVNENGLEEKMAVEENTKKAKDCSVKSQSFENAPKQEKAERGVNSVERPIERDVHTENIMSAQSEEAAENREAFYEVGECGSTLKMLQEPEEITKVQARGSEEKNDMMELKESQDWVQIDTFKQRKLQSQEERDNGSHEVQAGEEDNGKLDEIYGQEGNEKQHKEASDWVECEKELEENFHLEKSENKENDSPEEVTKEKTAEGLEQEVNKVGLDDPQEKEDKKIYRDQSKGEGNENLEEAEENDNTHKEDHPVNEIKKEQGDTSEQVSSKVAQLEIQQSNEDEKNIKATQQYLKYQNNHLEEANDAYKQDGNKSPGRPYEACGEENNHLEEANDAYKQDGNKSPGRPYEACGEENFEGVEASARAHIQNGRIMEANEVFSVNEDIKRSSKATEDANVLEEEETLKTGSQSQDFIQLNATKKQVVDLTETPVMDQNEVLLGDDDWNLESRHNICDVTVCKMPDSQEKLSEEVPCGLDENGEYVNESEIATNSEEDAINSASSHEERWSDSGIDSLGDPENCFKDVSCKWGENDEDTKQSDVNNDHEDDNYFESSSEERWVDTNAYQVDASQPSVFEERGKAMEFPQEENTRQSIGRNDEPHGKHHGILEEREAQDTLQQDAEMEKKVHRKRWETKEKEMEREKERIAVERAIREARERAFAEARERAEKAAMEKASAQTHQRLRSEARERLEKASAESSKATDKADKAQEAKLRAERAAVERATAEARKRALEKALSEKATFKTRNQSEKFAAEKLSGASKDGGTYSSDQQYKGPGPSSSSRYPSSSNQAGNDEPVQRSKASLERHQRMAERAAKALAEKNMRDLLAQKEQADRNRLAETLDAEVKRWSSGKERNLRALLSTLQYILGPDSGWQPIPLTELIAATAVKKAYRKATLFVHPDKLQQRGASIQQKYTCEKVFDLLKEAWNRFSAEEK